MKQKVLSSNGLAHVFASAALLLISSLFLAGFAHAADSLEERKLPMHFSWHDSRHDLVNDDGRRAAAVCARSCRGWVAAVGIITGDTPHAFAEFATGRDLKGATIVLDSSGGSVLDAISLGREWRELGVLTTVGITIEQQTADGTKAGIFPEAYCESMCVFLLLSGKTRVVPDGAHVRVHQIWMGDRAENASSASYTAQDVTIIERDVGRLAKYTFEMGGSGELLGLALSVPPWEPLHELTSSELRMTNLLSDDAVAQADTNATALRVSSKLVKDRFDSNASGSAEIPGQPKATKTAEALAPTEAAAPGR